MVKANYSEGDWFTVPLREGGFAVGVIARAMPGKKGILLGYFFGPRREHVPQLTELSVLSASDAVLVARFGDLGLIEGTWPLLGPIDGWDRNAWPIPAFGRLQELTGRALKLIYDDNDPSWPISEKRIDSQELADLSTDDLFGAGAVEIALTDLVR
jgi:Immunity protein 26